MVGLDKKVNNFNKGIYESINNESLSKGEKQLLAFARAIAKETSIYIFDEPTSNLDLKYEKQLENIINKILKNSTIIIIAHRYNTIKNVDRILEVKNKKIIMQNYKNQQNLKNN